jgi:uncharacterized protein (DUF1499 family)
MQRFWVFLLTVGAAFGLGMGCAGPRTGAVDGKLAPCPNSPNCVCSQDARPAHSIAPLTYTGPWPAARQKLLAVIRSMPRSRVVAEQADYIHVEFASAVFGFVDDVEFLVDAAAHLIQVRSAARVGYSDLGVNRRRVEDIRTKFMAGEQGVENPRRTP